MSSKPESPEQGQPIRFQVKVTELPANTPAVRPDGSPDFSGFVAALRKEARQLTAKVIEDDDLEEEEIPSEAARILKLANIIQEFAQEHDYL